MSEYKLDPVYISNNWTDEMLTLIIIAHNKRVEKINQTMSGEGSVKPFHSDKVVSDDELFGMLGSKLSTRRVNNGN